ncbi:MAG: ATP-binding cassette domain-containing protein [Solirubrobacteraceae bacterium]
MAETVLEVTDLRRVFAGRRGDPDRVAVDGLSLSLEAGGSLAIVGDSGSGKTTTLRMIAGLDRPTAGEIVVCGRTRERRAGTRERRRRARETQLVFQDPYSSLDPRRSVAEELAAVLELHFGPAGRERDTKVTALLELVGMSARHAPLRPRALSGGERQRVAIARALAAQPRVLLLDEPVSALDVSIQAQILNLLLDVRQQTGIAYVFVAHDLGVVRQVCDEVLVMRDGDVVERGPLRDVFASPRDPYTALLLASMPRPGWRPIRSDGLRGRASAGR